MNIRKSLFKILKNKDYLEIQNNMTALEKNLFTPEKINSLRLKNFLNKITENSDYYRGYKSLNIKDYPIMNKKTLSHNFSSVMTIKEEDKKKHYERKTSGSYGTPFKFIVSKSKILSQRSQILFFGEWSNFDLGTRHFFISTVKRGKLNTIKKNQILVNPEKINDEWVKKSVKLLDKAKPKVLVGYPSAIEMFAKEINRNNLSYDFVEGIIATGEALTQNATEEITKAFNVKPYSRYSSQELGVLGYTLKDSNNIILNQVDFHIEILDSNNAPVKVGEVGRVVVTDFHSDIIPLIRYDTGDLAKVSRYVDDLVIEIEHLEGRLIEAIYTTDGTMLTPFAINDEMVGYKNIEQIQFIQDTKYKYILKIVPIEQPLINEFQDLISHYEHLLGPNAEVVIEIVTEIKPLSSGKRPFIINRLNPSTLAK